MKQSLLSKSLLGAAVATTLASAPVMAEETQPAVAAPNGKVDISGGSVGRVGSKSATGSFSVPLGHSFGLQMDGGLSDSSKQSGGGVAAHLFYRDPEKYLFGATSLWVRSRGNDVFRQGLESEIYLNDFTFGASAGVQNSKARSTGYASVEGGYYPTDDLYTRIGVQGQSDYKEVFLGAEWKPYDDSGLSLFTDLGVGNYGGGYGIFGVRFSFGTNNANLKDQHRRFDPPNIIGYFNASGSGSSVRNDIRKATEPTPKAIRIDGGET